MGKSLLNLQNVISHPLMLIKSDASIPPISSTAAPTGHSTLFKTLDQYVDIRHLVYNRTVYNSFIPT